MKFTQALRMVPPTRLRPLRQWRSLTMADKAFQFLAQPDPVAPKASHHEYRAIRDATGYWVHFDKVAMRPSATDTRLTTYDELRELVGEIMPLSIQPRKPSTALKDAPSVRVYPLMQQLLADM